MLNKIIEKELKRQNDGIELIASENYVSKTLRELQGSILTNKYAEGYPGKRYYGGCEFVDEAEVLAQESAKKMFNAKFVNVQPHSGSQANAASYRAIFKGVKNRKVLALKLDHGGHLTHGHELSFSGQDYEFYHYGLDDKGVIDYKKMREIALEVKPYLIVTGASAYSREINFKIFKEVADEVGAKLMVDMAHIAGLVAANIHMSPILYADIVTTTTHKTLRGPRGGMILTNDEDLFKQINLAVFPGEQGGPLMHVIAAKAQCFIEALKPEFTEYQKRVVSNMKAMSDTLAQLNVKLISEGTDNHLLIIDVLSSYNMSGKKAERILGEHHITVNKNTIPNDTKKPFITSGIRIGTAAITSRGADEEFCINLANTIHDVLSTEGNTKCNLHTDKLKRVENLEF